MTIVTIIALIMLTLVGYAAGTALVTRGKEPQPPVYDLLLVLLLWVGAIATRDALGRWGAIGTWLLIGLGVGALLGFLRFRSLPVTTAEGAGRDQDARGGAGLGQDARGGAGLDQDARGGAGLLGRIWRRWSEFALEMGNYQGRILMGFFYFVVVTPFGLGMRLFTDPLAVKQMPPASGWVERASDVDSIEAAHDQG